LTSDVHVQVGGKHFRDVLQGFTCCAPHLPVPGRRKDRCVEPWSHMIQTYIHRDAVAQSGVRRLTTDYRLLLLFDGDELVAVGGHERVAPAGMITRYIDFMAVRTDMRGQTLSDGRRCSDAAWSMILDDVAERDPLVTLVTSDVDHRNLASIGFLTRTGALIGTEIVADLRPVVLLR
jgi:hypothetical protein